MEGKGAQRSDRTPLAHTQIQSICTTSPIRKRRDVGSAAISTSTTIGGCISRSTVGRRRKPSFKQQRLVKNRRPFIESTVDARLRKRSTGMGACELCERTVAPLIEHGQGDLCDLRRMGKYLLPPCTGTSYT